MAESQGLSVVISNEASDLGTGAAESAPPKSKGGRRKGMPKVPGSGRRKGATNALGKEARQWLAQNSNYLEVIARTCAGKAVRMAGPTGKQGWHYPDWADRKWAAELVARKLVPDVSAAEISGPDGGPIQQQTEILEASQRVLVAMSAASPGDDTVATIGPDALEGVKALNFIQASQEAAERAEAPLRYSAPVVDVPSPAASAEPVESVEEEPVPQGPPTPPDPGHVLRIQGSDWYVRALGPDRPGLPDVFELKCPTGLVRRGNFDLCLGLLTMQMGGVIDEWRIEAPAPQPEVSRPDQRAVRGWVQPQVNRRRPHP